MPDHLYDPSPFYQFHLVKIMGSWFPLSIVFELFFQASSQCRFFCGHESQTHPLPRPVTFEQTFCWLLWQLIYPKMFCQPLEGPPSRSQEPLIFSRVAALLSTLKSFLLPHLIQSGLRQEY